MNVPITPPEGRLTGKAAEIADRAAELFAQKGFSSTSIREIAEAAGVTKPTLYYYFGSKDGLVRHILETSVAVFRDSISSLTEETPLTEALVSIAHRQLEFTVQHPSIVALMARLDTCAPDELEGFDIHTERIKSHMMIQSLFQRALERGEVGPADPGLLTMNYVGALVVHIMAWVQRPEMFEQTPAEAAAAMVDLFMRGARPRPEELS